MANNREPMSLLVEEALETALSMKKQYEEVTVRCGLAGRSGTGKSSLINAIAGEKIAPVGTTETTMEQQEFVHGRTTFVDLPGCDTERWPRETYIERLGLADFDCVVIVSSDRRYEADDFLYRELLYTHKVPVFVVRSKVDDSIRNEARENGLSEEETLSKLRADLLRGFEDPPEKVYLVSAWYPVKWDLPVLIEDIAGSQDGIKHDRIVADMAAWSQKAIDAKRDVAYKMVSWNAIAAAANGLNPVPGLDVGVDLALLKKCSADVAQIYGISQSQLEQLQRTFPKLHASPLATAGMKAAAAYAARYLTSEAVLKTLTSLGSKIGARSLAKFLPFVGLAISAGLGYKMTTMFGEMLIEQAEDASRQLLEGLVNDKVLLEDM